MNPARKRAYQVVAVIALLASGLGAWGVDLVIGYSGRLAGALESVAPRHARLQGILDAREQTGASLALAGRRLDAHAYPSSMESGLAATAIQQRIRDAAASADLTIATTETRPARAQDGFEAILLTVNATGSMDSIFGFLSGLQASEPRLFIDAMTLGVLRARTQAPQEQQLAARITIGGYRLLP